jgi:hypothetical protein
MTKYQKLGLVAGQVLFGVGFGIGGFIVSSILIYVYAEVNQIRLDLFGEIMYAVIGGYLGTQAGVAFDGFRFLKRNGRQKDFLRFFGQSVAGMMLGLVLMFIGVWPAGQNISNAWGNFLALALPLTGAIIGFNFGLTTREQEIG